MKIDTYSLDFGSQHSATSRHSVQESLRTRIGGQRSGAEDNTRDQTRTLPMSMSASAPGPVISTAAFAAQAADQAGSMGENGEAQAIRDSLEETENDPRLLLIRLMVKMLTGEDIKVFSASDLQTTAGSETVRPGASGAGRPAQAAASAAIEYERHEIRSETEQTAFQASGIIRTSDGKEINFQLNLLMQRSYREESHVSLRIGNAMREEPARKDPLVINFNGAAAELQSQRFSFDLEGDGKQEQIALLGANSGYLALDLDQNGQIDSGRELFGVKSGNGFADLARYDDDGNGWIDENDAIYGQLRVWTPAADGTGQLATLKEKQVGALYLGSQATPFELRDQANQSLGGVRSSGIWLGENGQVGSLQQIDLTV